MNRFDYVRARTWEEAFAALAAPRALVIAGGTDIVPLLADHLIEPDLLVDISHIPDLHGIRYDERDGLWLGATTRLAEIGSHPVIRQHYGVLEQAIAESASAQIRNLATIGGNLLQKPRCPYYRDPAFNCLRHPGGTMCSAIAGDASYHAIIGYGARDPAGTCIAVHPSDAIVALAALEAQVVLRRPLGERRLHLADFYGSPSRDPRRETSILPDEIIVGIAVPPLPSGARGKYSKIRNRAAYEFAMVSAAAVIAQDEGIVRYARLALGGVSWAPYRAIEAENALIGQALTKATVKHAMDLALADAQPAPENAYKIPMARAALRRAIES